MNKKRGMLYFLLLISLLFAITVRLYRENTYNRGVDLAAAGKYVEAKEEFDQILGFKDSSSYSVYCEANLNIREGKYGAAQEKLIKLGDFKDSDDILEKLLKFTEDNNEEAFKIAEEDYYNKNYRKALVEFQVLGENDSVIEYIEKCKESIRIELGTTIVAGIQYAIGIDKEDGVQLAWTSKDEFDFSNWEDLVSISGTGDIVLGLAKDGRVYYTSTSEYANEYGVSIDQSKVSEWQNREVVQVVTGEKNAFVLFLDGSVDGIGRNTRSDDCLFRDWNKIVQISSSRRTLVAQDADGELFFYGQEAEKLNTEYEKNKSEWIGVKKIVVGGDSLPFVIGLKEDGTYSILQTTSTNIVKEEWNGHVKDVAAGDEHVIVVLENGTVDLCGNAGIKEYYGKDSREKVWECDNPAEISAGTMLSLAVSSDGKVYASGYDYTGQLGALEWDNNLVLD